MSDDDPVSLAERYFHDGLDLLTKAADILRGPEVPASTGSMRTEQALTRATDILRTTGFRAPRKG